MATTIFINEFDAAFGAEVVGITDVDSVLGAAESLRKAFDERQLLVFRDLDPAYTLQQRLTEAVIGLEPSEDADVRDTDDSYVSNRREGAAGPYGRLHFHSDAQWSSVPIESISLYAVEAEPPVVPTMFSSNTVAWDRMPEALRARVAGLEVIHIAGQERRDDEEDDDLLVAVPAERRSVTTPIGHRHPRTGKTMLYISEQHTHDVVGWSRGESDALLTELFTYLYDPATRVTHDWRTGDLALWDNVALQHGRSNVDLQGPARTLRKCVRPIEASIAASQAFAYTPEATDS
jgi:alpha-ketoglutarate-dependent taurine dioxygenase